MNDGTEQNIYLFRHSAYIAHSLNTNTAWKRKLKSEKKKKQHKVNNYNILCYNHNKHNY